MNLEELKHTREELARNRETLAPHETLVSRLKRLTRRNEPVTVEETDEAIAELDATIAAEEARLAFEASCAEDGPADKARAEALILKIDAKVAELAPLLQEAQQLADRIGSRYQNPALPGTLLAPFKGTPITNRLWFFGRDLLDQIRRWRVEMGHEAPILCRIIQPEPGTHKRPTLNEIRKIEAEARARGSRSTLASVQALGG
jgi:hypothetical protein